MELTQCSIIKSDLFINVKHLNKFLIVQNFKITNGFDGKLALLIFLVFKKIVIFRIRSANSH